MLWAILGSVRACIEKFSWFIVLPGIAISALIVYDSEWEEPLGTILVYTVSEQLEGSLSCTPLTVDVRWCPSGGLCWYAWALV